MLMVFSASGKYIINILFWSNSTKAITYPDGRVSCMGCPSLKFAKMQRRGYYVKEIA